MRIISTIITIFIISLYCYILLAQNIGAMLCHDHSQYICYTVKRGDNWEKLFPNQSVRDTIMRINRMNIPLERYMVIAIPKSDMNLTSYTPFPKQITPPGKKVIYVSINPSVLAWGAYNSDGYLKNWGPAVGARGWCPDIHRSCHTKLGNFFIYRKEGAHCISTKYPVPRGGAPMPYCMYFNGGFAIHGSYEVPGFNASHGCVRIFTQDAQWLNQQFVGNEKNITIIINNKK